MTEPNYKGQYETALTYQQNSREKESKEAEDLRKAAHLRLCEYSGLLERARNLMEDGHTYQALALMRQGLQWAGAALSDCERAWAAERRDPNPFLIPLKEKS